MKPIFIQGIELYLSEPVISDDELLISLFNLWQRLQGLEALRQLTLPIWPREKKLFDSISPMMINNAQDTLPLATETLRKVDIAIEKMKPLG
jgi:hypothetical protein